MQKLMAIIVLLVGAALLPSASRADTIVATATYGRGSATSHFSAKGKTITLRFELPSLLDSSLQAFNVPVDVTFHGSTVAESAALFFFTAGEGGLFDIGFKAGAHAYEWDFFGGQLFTAGRHLLPGDYVIDPGASGFFKDFSANPTATICSGTVVVIPTSSVPEPTSLLFPGMGLFGVLPAARKRRVNR